MFITAKIAFIFTSLSALQIYDLHIFTAVYSPLHEFIWNQHSDQLPVGLLAHLVEHWTGIAEVMGSSPIQAWIFFRPSFHYCLSSVHYYEDRFHIHVDCIVADHTESIKLALWEDMIQKVDSGKSYLFKRVAVKSFDDTKCLNAD